MGDDDFAVSERIYASTRVEEIARSGWPVDLQHAFLRQQHAAQHAHYRAHYRGADWWMIERDGVALGRLFLMEGASEIRIIDIALLPQARGAGIGGALLEGILADAAERGKQVTIHVEHENPAQRLYRRLGFELVDADRGAYMLMGWTPLADPRG